VRLRDAVLWPFALPYEAISRLHARAYKSGFLPQRKLDAFVISVGNLTVGGTGKTPMVLCIAQQLLSEGKRVGILTRGYRGDATLSQNASQSATESSGVFTGDDSSSDEVQLMKSILGDRVAFGVGADRFARGSELVAHGINYLILDDGFQHRRLSRDVDIVLIDATNPFGGGHLLPAGRLREPRSALARADIIVITRSEYSPAVEAAIHQDSTALIFYARTHLESICRLGHPPADIKKLRHEKFFAFCGIGNPSAFVSDLRTWGLNVAGEKFFRDHHQYSQADFSAIEAEARNAGATASICTEKDLFNFGEMTFHLPLYLCAISFHIDRADEFWRAVTSHLHSKQASP
jgi:tetraacyldisaccharide 4'-kinase